MLYGVLGSLQGYVKSNILQQLPHVMRVPGKIVLYHVITVAILNTTYEYREAQTSQIVPHRNVCK